MYLGQGAELKVLYKTIKVLYLTFVHWGENRTRSSVNLVSGGVRIILSLIFTRSATVRDS